MNPLKIVKTTPRALAVIHRILQDKGWTISTAESLTAGLISGALASKSGSSAYLRGGISAYTLDAKVNLLGVNRATAEMCDCVSEVVACEMVWGAQAQFGTECVIAVTGYADAVPAPYARLPFVHWAVLCDQTLHSGLFKPGWGQATTRNAIRRATVNITLCVLANHLLELERNAAE